MQFLKYGIGIDVASQKFDACVSVIDIAQAVKVKATRSFENTQGGFKAFLSWADKHCKLPVERVFLMEATGVYFEQLAWFLFKGKQSVSVILPTRARRYMQSLGLKSKNDSIDAKGLSRMACEQQIRLWKPISENLYIIRIHTRQIERLNAQVTQMNNQLHAMQRGMYRDKTIERMMITNIARLKKQRDKLENNIESIVQKDAALKQHFDNICQIKGLGMLTLAVIIAETDGFALIENQSQLVSYAGYDVVENQSGKRVGKTRISKKGNSHIRRALHMPALNMVRYKHDHFANLYERIYERTGIKMKGYVAIQKKLLVVIHALWKNSQAYDLNYHKTFNDVEMKPSFVTKQKQLPKELH